MPADVAAGEAPAAAPDPAVADLMARIESLARRHGVAGHAPKTGRRWGVDGQTILGVYTTTSGMSFWLPETATVAGQDTADEVRSSLEALFPGRKLPAMYPAFMPTEFQERWNQGGSSLLDQLFTRVAGRRQDA